MMAVVADFAVSVSVVYGHAAETDAAAAACVPAALRAVGDDLAAATADGDESVKFAVCVLGGRAAVQMFEEMIAATGVCDAVGSVGRENPE